jgi:hypothetical protein
MIAKTTQRALVPGGDSQDNFTRGKSHFGNFAQWHLGRSRDLRARAENVHSSWKNKPVRNSYFGFLVRRETRSTAINLFQLPELRSDLTIPSGTTMTVTTLDEWIEDFVALINSATMAKNTHEQAIALKNDHLPDKIYKYRRDDDWSRGNLENDLIWMASPNDYNDPYDCLFKIDQAQAVREYKNTVSAITLSITTLPTEAQITNNVEGGIKVLQDFRDKTKVCSFSAANDLLLMWGHYACEHKGFCIEYDLEPMAETEFLRRNLYPVIYSKDLYDMTPLVKGAVSIDTSAFNPVAPLLSVLQKFAGWSYEREWRVVQFNLDPKANHPHSVPKASKVFLGSKMDANNASEIAAICAKKGIPVFKMELAKDKFELFAHPYVAH